jgi:uncharacterized phage protein (TIGR01671 family)
MRQIIFRAKRVDTGEWVEGNYFTDQVSKGSNPCVDISLIRDDLHQDFEVKENTVGQFTGELSEKNEKIFAGHIVKGRSHANSSSGAIKGVVIWNNDLLTYQVRYTWKSHSRTHEATEELFRMHHIEILGNIHDNPDRLL